MLQVLMSIKSVELNEQNYLSMNTKDYILIFLVLNLFLKMCKSLMDTQIIFETFPEHNVMTELYINFLHHFCYVHIQAKVVSKLQILVVLKKYCQNLLLCFCRIDENIKINFFLLFIFLLTIINNCKFCNESFYNRFQNLTKNEEITNPALGKCCICSFYKVANKEFSMPCLKCKRT